MRVWFSIVFLGVRAGPPKRRRRCIPIRGVVVKIPPLWYAMPMRGGFRYIVRIQADYATASVGAKLTATEEDAEGNVTNQFSPASADAAAECRSGG